MFDFSCLIKRSLLPPAVSVSRFVQEGWGREGNCSFLNMKQAEEAGKAEKILMSQRPFLISSFFCPPYFVALPADLLRDLMFAILAASGLLMARFACRAALTPYLCLHDLKANVTLVVRDINPGLYLARMACFSDMCQGL